MSLPTNILDNFMECCRSIPELGVYMENGINIDPIPLTMEQFAVAGDMDGKPVPPFKNLHIRVRNQVVADGLEQPLDWQSAGYDMPPMEWHEILKKAKQTNENGNTDGDAPILFDCRNTYETAVGQFDGAEPLDTTNFRDSWNVLKDRLKDTPKDAPIMTYCTGGIRCVKVGAYLTQELGFKNVSRLAGGIIAYDRALNDFNNNNDHDMTTKTGIDVEEGITGEESMFKGTNYVFDGRVGRRITDDALGECITCGAKTNLISNCRNSNCHKRMVQCEKCHEHYHGTCSEECKQRVINSKNNISNNDNDNAMTEIDSSDDKIINNDGAGDGDYVKYNNLDDYSAGYSTPPPSLLKEIELNTAHYMSSGSHMVSGASQGRLLTSLASMTRSGRILELGTFTGYATASLLEGASLAGEAIGTETTGNRTKGPFVLTLERDTRAVDIAAAHIQIMSNYGTGIVAAEQACKLRSDDNVIEEVKEDSSTFTYGTAGCEIRRVNDALAVVETMSSKEDRTNYEMEPFDIVFVDADKTRLLEYVEACLDGDKLLNKGGLIIVDNVLWKGLVLDVPDFGNSHKIFDENGVIMSNKELKKSRRARKLATLMHKFNSAIIADDRVEVVLLPIRDGLSILRKR